MNKTQKILLISFCALFSLLLAELFVVAGVSVAKNGMQGMVGELLADTDAQTEGLPDVTQGVTEELTTQSEQDKMMELLFDLDRTQIPSPEDFYQVENYSYVTDIVECAGKPHGILYTSDAQYLYWEMTDGEYFIVRPNLVGKNSDLLLQENYGGAFAMYIFLWDSLEIGEK